MKNNFVSSLNCLKQITSRFDAEANRNKTGLLNTIRPMALPAGKYLLQYHDLLLFLCAYPTDPMLRHLAEKELKRIAINAKGNRTAKKPFPENTGLPYTTTLTRFSPDFLYWLHRQKDIRVDFDSFHKPSVTLNEVLNITLPSLLKPETTAGLNNEDLLRALQVKPRQYIPFLLGQLNQLSDLPQVKDLLKEHLDVYVKLIPVNLQFSRAFNRIPLKQVYYQPELLKQFDHEQLINDPLPPAVVQGKADKQQLIQVIKYAKALAARETDTVTYMQEDSLRRYSLDRGIDVAIYGMIPQRQLPLESYVGFTLFKNGFPVSYGGAWIFGQRAKIGINIFESFRGGESGYIMCQLLRVYKQVFSVSFFEAEPYQYGLDNPDGITSGAFWFYYRYGFRPLDPTLRQVAENEYHKIKSRKNYRSPVKTLVRFTQSNIALNLGKTIPPDVSTVSANLLSFLKKDWQHHPMPAKQAINRFCKKAKLNPAGLSTDEKNVLEEVALWAMAMHIDNPRQLRLMKEMVFTKPKDLYTYQQLLLAFLEN